MNKEETVKDFVKLIREDLMFYVALVAGMLVAIPLIGYLGWIKTQVIAAGCGVSGFYRMFCPWYNWLAASPYHYAGVVTLTVVIGLGTPLLRARNKFKKKR